MSKKITFTAQKRDTFGKKTKNLRSQGIIPANVHGDIDKPISIAFPKNSFNTLYQEVGDTGLFYLTIEGDGKDLPVLVDGATFHPVSDELLHVVLKKVNLKEKITAQVPVELVGENTISGAVVVAVMDSVEVEALPTDLPEKFEIDISKLTEIGQSVTYQDLDYDKNLVSLMIAQEEFNNPLVLLQEQKEEVEEEPTPETEVIGDQGTEKPTETGETPAAPTPTE